MADIAMIVGTSDYNFTNDRREVYTGRKYHCLVYPSTDRVQGYEAVVVGASTQLMSTWVTADSVNPKRGDVVEISYTRNGRLAAFRPVSENARALFDSVIIS